MTDADPYFLGYREAEQDRLGRQAQEFAADSNWLFDAVGVLAGWRVVEIGCGSQGCLGLLAARVGATGRVVGVERSAEQVQRARRLIVDSHLTNVEVLHADGRETGLPEPFLGRSGTSIQPTLNPLVADSNPTGPTNIHQGYRANSH